MLIMESPIFELPVGLNYNGAVHKSVELLVSNGIAEKVFTKKLADRPFTWQAQVISVAVRSIGDINIGVAVREEFLSSGTITIPAAVLALSLADMNTLLVEIHRKCWQDLIPKQDMMCKMCMKQLTTDIDLNKIVLDEKDTAFLASGPDLNRIVCYLKTGFKTTDTKELTGSDWEQYVGLTFNKLIYKVPTIKEAISNEKFFDNSIVFWRRIAFDCLRTIAAVENPDKKDEKTLDELPESAINFLGIRFYDLVLSGMDLKIIRGELMEYLPTLPFMYEEECPCERALKIPYVMEATNFFSE